MENSKIRLVRVFLHKRKT